MRIRRHGRAGPHVVLLHGGPGAPGTLGALARGLAGAFRVLEPFQCGSGGEPLTVARHVEDLRELVAAGAAGERPALVGSSWGAMLALAFAAAHPDLAGPLALVGCATFDAASRAASRAAVEARVDRAALERLAREVPDADARLRAEAELLLPAYTVDLASRDLGDEPVDARAHEETWADMLRLQAEGVYPAAFAAIRSPALVLHGADDPHPGRRIHDSLKPHLPRLAYREFKRCGHYPWLERAAAADFHVALTAFLSARRTSA